MMDSKKRYPGRTVSETGKYNLHVVVGEDEYQLLEKLCELSDVPKADLIRRLILGGAMLLGIPLPPATLASHLANELRPPKKPKNGKKLSTPSPAVGSIGACSSSTS